MRLFIASFITEKDIKEAINLVQSELSNIPGKFKPVNSEIIHFTYQFIGEVQPHIAEKIKNELSQINFPEKFDALIKGVGVFPPKGNPRVVWAGVEEGSENMIKLANNISSALRSIGIKPDKSFKPHLTIARVKFVNNMELFNRWKEKFSSHVFGKQNISRFNLVKSILTRQGPIYKTVMEYELR